MPIIERINSVLFGDGKLSDFSNNEIAELRMEAPLVSVLAGKSLIDVLVDSGLATSKREAREFIEAGAIGINDVVITDINTIVEGESFSDLVVLRRGKKNKVFIEIN